MRKRLHSIVRHSCHCTINFLCILSSHPTCPYLADVCSNCTHVVAQHFHEFKVRFFFNSFCSVRLVFYLSIYLPIYLSIFLSLYLSICLTIYLSILRRLPPSASSPQGQPQKRIKVLSIYLSIIRRSRRGGS